MAFRSTTSSGSATPTLTTLVDYYQLFEWRVPMLVKKMSVRVVTAASGTTNLYGRLYAINASGRPGKLLIDFGVLGTANSSLNSGSTTISSAVHSTGFYLTPGEYFSDIVPSFSTGSPTMFGGNLASCATVGRIGSTTLLPYQLIKATGATAGAGPDPANVTGYAGTAGTASSYHFALSPS